MPRLGRLLALLLLVAASAPRGGLAQDSDVRLAAAARDFFAQGLRFADKSQWEQAADRFRRALTIRYSPVIAFNLASSLDELGELVEASELLYRVEADEEADEALRQSSTRLLGSIRKRLAQLTVLAEGRPGDSTVTLDGLRLPDVQLNAPFPVDPGHHEVVLLRGQHTLAREQVELAAGGKAEVSLAPARVPTPAELAALEMANQNRVAGDDEPPLTERWWFWAGVGTAIAGVVTIVTIAALSGDSQRAMLPTQP